MTDSWRPQRFDLVEVAGYRGQIVGLLPSGRVRVLWNDGATSDPQVWPLRLVRPARAAVSRHGRWTIRRVPIQVLGGGRLIWVWRWRVTAPHTVNGVPVANVYMTHERAVEMMLRWHDTMAAGA